MSKLRVALVSGAALMAAWALVGGPGRDVANSGPDRDICSAEVQRNCESSRADPGARDA